MKFLYFKKDELVEEGNHTWFSRKNVVYKRLHDLLAFV